MEYVTNLGRATFYYLYQIKKYYKYYGVKI